MILCTKISELNVHLIKARKAGKTIGFVPTMGALHNGHISLINRAKAGTDLCICSVFVNPTQFNNAHDLAVYPRTLEADCDLLQKANCDIVFAPNANEMYPVENQIKFNFGALEHVMEGKFRPGHFNGVGIVVSKLFNIVGPDKAFFGQKDIQQCAVINRLVMNLSFQLELIICETERETDGLAMSSRNRNLLAEQRVIAPNLYINMQKCLEKLKAGWSVTEVKLFMEAELSKIDGIELEYFEIVNRENLETIEKYMPDKSAMCIAAFLGKTRLIDNILI
jgi:pantoate--beta-alanine ligase